MTTPTTTASVSQPTPIPERPTREGVIAFMEEAERIVAAWPEWKRQVLRPLCDSLPPRASTPPPPSPSKLEREPASETEVCECGHDKGGHVGACCFTPNGEDFCPCPAFRPKPPSSEIGDMPLPPDSDLLILVNKLRKRADDEKHGDGYLDSDAAYAIESLRSALRAERERAEKLQHRLDSLTK